MSEDKNNLGFGKFVPGFDFLQNLAKGAQQTLPQMPNLSNWVAPTLSVEELEKRIGDLKAVHFWLDQNAKALSATIQALEVQKMTLATLQGMNLKMSEVADALKLKPFDVPAARPSGNAAETSANSHAPRKKAPAKSADTKSAHGKATEAKPDGAGSASGVIDPLQWWGSLTQQFQQIAANAMKDVASQATMNTTRPGTASKTAAKADAKPARKAAAKRGTKKAAAH